MDYVITHPIVLLTIMAFSAVGFVALVAVGLYYAREPREIVDLDGARKAAKAARSPD